jgi:hypothetical protein
MIYFLHNEAGKAIKIGHSGGLKGRLSDIQVGNHVTLVLLGTIPGDEDEETRLHDMFADQRIRGEWFHAEMVLPTVRRLLIDHGIGRTVQDELTRRHGCRVGLRGVLVALEEQGPTPYRVFSCRWNAESYVELKLVAKDCPEDILYDIPAACCVLLSDWPIICRCWCGDPDE